jgi:citrate lyase subunit beta/citryl-CoA lyase
MAKEYIAKLPGDKSWVRVNAVPSGYLHEDLAEFVGTPGLAGFVVPKQDSPGDVAAVDRMLASVEVHKGLPAGSTPIIVMIESASGVLSSLQIITAAKRVESVIYAGGEDGDMNVSLGATWSSEGPEMMFVRQFTFVAARAANIKYPLDGVFSNIRDLEGFKRDTTLSKRLGFRGRTVIHPTQIEAANQIYMPTAAEIDYATRVLKAFDEALARGTASTTVDGKLVDVAMAKTASNILELVATITGRNQQT